MLRAILVEARRVGHLDGRQRRGAAAGLPGLTVTPALRLKTFTRDSVGLSSADRQANIAGRIRLLRPVSGTVLLVDDIVTTGATAAESVRVLQTAGAAVAAVVTVAHA